MNKAKLKSLFLVLALTFVLPAHLAAQQPKNNFPKAVERSVDAALIVSLLANAASGFPKELVDKAEAVAVLPHVSLDVSFISHTTRGFGVISSRTAKGWTMPAFYRFYGDAFGDPFGSNETFAIIMLFMNKDAVEWFAEGRLRMQGKKQAVAGPVGTLNDSQRLALSQASLIAYAYYNGELSGTGIHGNFLNTFSLNPDNKINKPLYGLKGRQVLAGERVAAASLPPGIADYQKALEKHYSRP